MLSGLKDSASVDGWHHGRCVVHRLGAEGVLMLPAAARAKLILADTGVELMRALLGAQRECSERLVKGPGREVRK
jgi:hypothetical protein